MGSTQDKSPRTKGSNDPRTLWRPLVAIASLKSCCTPQSPSGITPPLLATAVSRHRCTTSRGLCRSGGCCESMFKLQSSNQCILINQTRTQFGAKLYRYVCLKPVAKEIDLTIPDEAQGVQCMPPPSRRACHTERSSIIHASNCVLLCQAGSIETVEEITEGPFFSMGLGTYKVAAVFVVPPVLLLILYCLPTGPDETSFRKP